MKSFTYFIFMLAMIGCSSSQPTKPSKNLYLDQSVLSNESSAAGWLAYGMALTAWEPEYLQNGTPDFFKREVYARETAAQIWKELKQNDPSKSDSDLDLLESVSDAGFMAEYLWVYLKNESWRYPGNLQLSEFERWAASNLINHVPVTNPGISVGP